MSEKLWVPVSLFLFLLCALYFLLDQSGNVKFLGKTIGAFEDCSDSIIAEEPCKDL